MITAADPPPSQDKEENKNMEVNEPYSIQILLDLGRRQGMNSGGLAGFVLHPSRLN